MVNQEESTQLDMRNGYDIPNSANRQRQIDDSHYAAIRESNPDIPVPPPANPSIDTAPETEPSIPAGATNNEEMINTLKADHLEFYNGIKTDIDKRAAELATIMNEIDEYICVNNTPNWKSCINTEKVKLEEIKKIVDAIITELDQTIKTLVESDAEILKKINQ